MHRNVLLIQTPFFTFLMYYYFLILDYKMNGRIQVNNANFFLKRILTFPSPSTLHLSDGYNLRKIITKEPVG